MVRRRIAVVCVLSRAWRLAELVVGGSYMNVRMLVVLSVAAMWRVVLLRWHSNQGRPAAK